MVFHNRASNLHATVLPIQSEFRQFQGVIRHARTPSHRSTHIREMRATTPPWILGLSHLAPHAHDACPLDLTLRVVRSPAPRTPHTQKTCAVHAHKNTAMHRLHTCSAQYATQMLKLQNHFSRLLRHPFLEMAYSYL